MKGTRPLRDLLAHAEIIGPFSLGSGFPSLMPHGVRLIERLHQLYRDALDSKVGVEIVEPPVLLPEEEYRATFAATFDYANVYSTTFAGRRWVIRPDALPWLVARRHGRASGDAQLSLAPLFRAETADPQPLLRDRHIWGVAQAVHLVDVADVNAAWERHVEAVSALHSALGLPTLVVEAPPLRSHARRRALTYTLVGEVLELTSTLYLLGDPLRLAVGAEAQVIEFGYTAKLIALAALLHADDLGIRLPSVAAVPAIGVVARTAADSDAAAQLAADGDRWEYIGGPYRRAMRAIRRGGSPACVLLDAVRTDQLYRRLDDWTFEVARASVPDAVAAAVQAHDERLWREAVEQQQPLIDPVESSDVRLEPPGGEGAAAGWHELGVVAGANYPDGSTRVGFRLLSRERRHY